MSADAGDRLILRDDPMPYYEQLKRVLLEQVRQGRLKPGDMLPSEGQLCQTYGVSRTVVRQAIGELANDGLVQRIRGRGTFVVETRPRRQFLESSVRYMELALQAFPVTEFTARFTDVSADKAAALKLTGDTACIEVVRLHSEGARTVARSSSWIPSSESILLRRLQAMSPDDDSIYTQMEEHFGFRLERGEREISAAAATPDIAEHLQVDVGAPVLLVRSLVLGPDNSPIELSEVWFRHDVVHLDVDIVRSRH
jgi:GntR family transcriptional regulator